MLTIMQEKLRASIVQLNQRLQTEALSLNDLPHLVLALLSSSDGMRKMPQEKRWHTIGGQTQSALHVALVDQEPLADVARMLASFIRKYAEPCVVQFERESSR